MASLATICEWANVSVGNDVRAFKKAGIIFEGPHSNKIDSDTDERELGVFDCELAQPFISEAEDFDVFVDEG